MSRVTGFSFLHSKGGTFGGTLINVFSPPKAILKNMVVFPPKSSRLYEYTAPAT